MKTTNFSPQASGHFVKSDSIGDMIDDSGGGHQATHPAVLGLNTGPGAAEASGETI